MIGMKFDMSGAAAVLEATGAIAELGLPIEVVTVIGATENMIGRRPCKADDVVTAANGKTVEINNTDAEGRLVLADCLHHARSLGATHVVDLATLTGAVVTALGDLHAGLFVRGEEFAGQIASASETSGDMLWRMPLHDTYKRFYRSEVADMVNASFAGRGGACYAGPLPPGVRGRGRLGAPRHRRRRRPRPQPRRRVRQGRHRLRRAAPDRAREVDVLSYDLSDEHRLFRSTVREFAEGAIAPVAEELDREGRFPLDIVRQAAELGLLGIPIAAEWGGAGVGHARLRDRDRGAGPRRPVVRHHGRRPHVARDDADRALRDRRAAAPVAAGRWPRASGWRRSA